MHDKPSSKFGTLHFNMAGGAVAVIIVGFIVGFSDPDGIELVKFANILVRAGMFTALYAIMRLLYYDPKFNPETTIVHNPVAIAIDLGLYGLGLAWTIASGAGG